MEGYDGWPNSVIYGPDGWPFEPSIWCGGIPQMPLAFDFLAEIETPEAQRLFVFEGPEVSEGAYSVPLPEHSLGFLREYGQLWWPAESIPHVIDVADATSQDNPYATQETIQWVDDGRCIDVDADQIALDGRVWDLARIQVPRYNLVSMEAIGFRAIATALNELQQPIASFVLDGDNPCSIPITHPDGAVANPLGFSFSVLLERIPSDSDGSISPFLVGAIPNLVPSASPIAIWNDLRYGWQHSWPTINQYLEGGRSIVRYLVTITGDPNRWTVRMFGRLSGYTQAPGRRDGAVRNAICRT